MARPLSFSSRSSQASPMAKRLAPTSQRPYLAYCLRKGSKYLTKPIHKTNKVVVIHYSVHVKKRSKNISVDKTYLPSIFQSKKRP